MKRDKLLLTTFITLISAYILCVVLFAVVLPNSLFIKLWFTNFLIFLSVFLFVKSYLYVADSTLFLAMLLLLIGISNYIIYFLSFNETMRYSMFLLATSLSFLAVFVKFKRLFYLTASVMTLLFTIPLFLWAFSCINPLTLISLLFLVVIIDLVFLMLKKRR